MASSVETRRCLRDELKARGWKPTDLVRETGLGIDAVRRAIMGGSKRTNIRTARRIADAMGGKVDDFFWPAGLTHVGRPPLTGGSYARGTHCETPDKSTKASTDLARDNVTLIEMRRRIFEDKFCSNPEHNLVLPLSGLCGMCAA